MLRIDFYLQHLVKNNAQAIQLGSNQVATFVFPGGPRKSNSPVPHAQLVQLIQEVGPPDALENLRKTGRASFAHTGEGVTVSVHVEAQSNTSWTVELQPDNGVSAVAASRGGARGAATGKSSAETPKAAPAPAPARESVKPPRIQLAPGEPRLNLYLRQMVAVKASDLHMSSTMPALVRRHGEMKVLDDPRPLNPQELMEIMLEIMPERNRTEFQENWDTDFAHAVEGVARFRVNYFMDRNGPGLVCRQIPFEILSAQKLGIPEKVLDLCWLTKGLVLVTGPTGSGKSTTLAGLIDFINDNRSDHLITIEDPIEFVHPNKKCLVNQREVHQHTKSFKNALRAALREDPDIVLVGEMRDLETISIAIETAETGHLVFGTLHTTSAPSTVDRIVDQFPADRQEQIRIMLSESLRGVISQVLCKKIGGGRVAAQEILIANAACANLIREGKTFQLRSVMQTGRNQGMQTMNDHLLEHVLQKRVEPLEAYMKSNDKMLFKEMLTKNNIKIDLAAAGEGH